MKVVARYSGLLAYSDGSKQQFAGHLDERGNTSVNLQSESEEAVYQLQQQSGIDDMLALLSGSVVLTPSPDPTPATKTVVGLQMELSGMVAYDNNDKGGFIVQYTDKTGAFTPSGGDDEHWQAALDNSEALANLVALFESVVGEGNATVTP